jgi:hypothetical protein
MQQYKVWKKTCCLEIAKWNEAWEKKHGLKNEKNIAASNEKEGNKHMQNKGFTNEKLNMLADYIWCVKKIALQLHNTMELPLEAAGAYQTWKRNAEKVEVDFQVTRQ